MKLDHDTSMRSKDASMRQNEKLTHIKILSNPKAKVKSVTKVPPSIKVAPVQYDDEPGTT